MTSCILLLSNHKDDHYFVEKTTKLGESKGFSVFSTTDFSQITDKTDFAFAINYQKLIPAEVITQVKNGIYVFHSSDLPKGRGWAPIYHSIVNKENPDHVLTMLKINEKIDDGEIIAKSYFKKRAGENADSLREIDNVMTMKLIYETVDDLLQGELTGIKQEGKGSYYKKRTPEDSQIKSNQTLEEIHYHALAVTDDYPAFYSLGGKKFIVKIRPEQLDELQESDIRIKRYYK